MSKTVHIICILDQSSSMSPLASSVVDGFNEFIDAQKKIKGKAKVSLYLFSDATTNVFKKRKLKDVKPLKQKDYMPNGMTALYDAVGDVLSEFSKKKKAIVFIQTDGQENSSREWLQYAVKALIEQKTKDGWAFKFLGANIDAAEHAKDIGVATMDSMQVLPTSSGMRSAYENMSAVATTYRTENNQSDDS